MTDVVGVVWRELQFQSPIVEARTFDQRVGPYDKFTGLKGTDEIVVFCVRQQNHSAIRVLRAFLNELTIFVRVFEFQKCRKSLAIKFWSRLITGSGYFNF